MNKHRFTAFMSKIIVNCNLFYKPICEFCSMSEMLKNDFEQRLKAAEEKAAFYQLIADNTYDWEVFRNHLGKIIYVNNGFERITGYKKEDLLNRSIREKDIVHPDDWVYAKSVIELFQNKKEIVDFEFRIIAKDKSVKFLNLNAIPVFSKGEFSGTRISIRDISKQKDFAEIKKMQRSLLLTENKFQTYIQSSPTAVFLTNEYGQYTFANPAACELLEYTEHELIKLSIPDIIPEEHRDAGLKNFLTIKEQGKTQNFTISLKKRSGDLVDVVLDGCKLNNNEYIAFVKDITQLRKAERILKEQNAEYEAINEELRQANEELYELRLQSEESRLQYERLFENMEQAFALHEMIFDEKGNPIDYRFLLINKAFERVTGLSAEKAIGKTVLELLPGTESVWIDTYGKVAATGKSCHLENYSKELDAHFDVVAYSPKKDQFAVILSDVSELKKNYKLLEKAKKEAEESEARFKALQNASFGGIFLHHKGIIFDCNKSLCDLTGYSRDELIGMNGLLLVTEESRAILAKNIEHESETPYEAICLRKDGTKFPIRLEARNIPYKGQQARSVEVRNILDYKNALKTAEENKKHLELFINSGPDLFFLKDRNLRYVLSNKANNKFLNQPADAVIGKTDRELMPPEIAKECQKTDNEAIEKKQIVKNIEVVDNIAYETWKIPVFENNQVVGIAGIIRDVNKQVQAEKELTTAKNKAEQGEHQLRIKNQEYETLNEELRQTNEELSVAKQRAEESNRLKTAFLNNISHEFRTPMNGILGFAELFLRPGKTPDQQSKYTTIIRENCDRLLDLVTDTVEISSIHSGAVKINKETIKIADIVTDVIRVTKPLAEKKEIGFIINNQTTDNQKISTDRYKLYRLLKHVTTNGIKFTTEGHVKFTCFTESHELIFIVEDTGTGIEDALLENIYEPYKQFGSDEFHNTGGTGIGLSLVKAYINLLGGHISIESVINKGTKVKLSLPL